MKIKWKEAISEAIRKEQEWLRTLSAIPAWIVLASAVALFAEMAIVRWHVALFPIFGFYKNVSLLSFFLGLGLGYAAGNRRPLFTATFVLCLLIQCLFFLSARFFLYDALIQNPVPEQFTMGIANTTGLLGKALVIAFLSFTFLLNALTAIPLGQLCAFLMDRTSKLKAYSWNLVGSLLGILAFILVSFCHTPPTFWFVLVFLALIPFLIPTRLIGGFAIAGAFVTVCLIGWEGRGLQRNIYSPYQVISVHPGTSATTPVKLGVNHLYFQTIFNLSLANQSIDAEARERASYYELPYQVKPRPQNVLIVGAGTGNDVAAGLRKGAAHIDAVEIDPAIQYLGRILHPEKPYSDARVTSIINDARTFIRETPQFYDLIVYGLLDSHTLLSNVSNVRLDSFVYTVEGFKDSRRRLAKDGVMALSFCMLDKALGKKLYLMLSAAFDGQEPVVVDTITGTVFLIGPGVTPPTYALLGSKNALRAYASEPSRVDVSSDDWPFFYMPRRAYPNSYLTMVIVFALISALLIKSFLPSFELNDRRSWREPIPFFFLGAGFMLIETRSITELGLVLGNTWLVIAEVISGILIAAWCSNYLVDRLKRVNLSLMFCLLIATLALGWWIRPEMLEGLSGGPAKGIMILIAVAPLFFSGFFFSSALKRTDSLPLAMGYNLFGSLCGGLLEYNSMYFGFRSLYFLAMAMYAAAYLPKWSTQKMALSALRKVA